MDKKEKTGERIAKRMARAGACSRRDAERLIAAGRVQLNGRVLDSPAVNVTPEDRIVVDGVPLPAPARARLWRYHKPRGLVTSHSDEQGRPTVFENLPQELPRVISVGRLDLNSEGLLLLTNDGGLARKLELPSSGLARRYRVRAFGEVGQKDLDRLRDGMTLDGLRYGPIEAAVDQKQGDNIWMTLTLHEGKNREIRRVLEALGLQVNRLLRLSYGPFALDDLAPGQVREVPRQDIPK